MTDITKEQHEDNLHAIYWAEVAGDQRDRMDGRKYPTFDAERIYILESQADLHALRAIGSSNRIVYVVPVTGGFRLATSELGAITRWSRFGCKSLKTITPLVEMR